MSPYRLRRFRAERLLRQEFSRLRSGVLAAARSRLRAHGMALDESDLEACYAQAWQGLYAALLEGREIVNLTGWLSLVTFRRAVEEHRSRSRRDCLFALPDGARQRQVAAGRGSSAGEARAGSDADLAATVDDRHRLRQLFEALRLRLSERELQAAALCYLQGLARAEAAQAMGISERRMRRLMEGRGPGRPGVAAKVGALAETIREGAWCEEQGSLMRGLAFGILDPAGERYRFALAHSDGCPACRAYVASLRGLAALVPPVPALAHMGLAAGALGEAAGCLAGSGAAAGNGGGAACGASGAAPSPLSGAGGLLPASGGAAGGGWLLAGGGAGVKLAAGCALALGVGAGCMALGGQPAGHVRPHHHERARQSGTEAVRPAADGARRFALPRVRAAAPGTSDSRYAQAAQRRDAGTRISREFGLEGGGSAGTANAAPPAPPAAAAARNPSARAAARRQAPAAQAPASDSAAPQRSRATPSAQREFDPA